MASDDLLAYLKVEAEVFDDYTIHRSYKRNRATGLLEKTETKWVRTECLNEGLFGQVWLEYNNSPGEHAKARAVKVIKKDQMRKLKVDYKRELSALATFSKEEYRQAGVLVAFLGWFENGESVFIAMEYLQQDTLAMHISSISEEDEVRQITTDLLEGLKIMHNEHFTHRDLKPQNIFVVEKPPRSRRWWVKIGDFGSSKRVKNEDTALRTQIGTAYFQAPEIHGFVDSDETSEYDSSVDVWSLGCVVYNISAQRIPFLKLFDVNNFCQGRSQLPKEPLARVLSKAGIGFIERLLVPEPARRITISQALRDPWVLNASVLEANTDKPSGVASPEFPGAGFGESQIVSGLSTYHLRARTSTISNDTTGSSQQDKTKNLSDSKSEAGSGPNLATIPLSDANAEAEADHTMVPKIYERLSSTDVLAGRSKSSLTSEPSVKVNPPPQANSEGPVSQHQDGPSAQQQSAATSSGSDTMIGDISWDISSLVLAHGDAVGCVAFAPSGPLLASGSADKTLRLWNISTGTIYRDLSGHRGLDGLVAFSPDGVLLAFTSDDRTIRLNNLVSRNMQRELSVAKGVVYSVAFSPDGKLLASSWSDRMIRIWYVDTGQLRGSLSGHRDQVVTVAFSPDGTLLASSSDDGTIRLWNVDTGLISRELLGHYGAVGRIVFSPDGSLLASGGQDATARLWYVATGKPYENPLQHSGSIWGLAFSPDGVLLATCASEREVRLWTITTGQCYRQLSGHMGKVTAVAFSPDGTLFATGSTDGAVRLWGNAARLKSIKEGLKRKKK